MTKKLSPDDFGILDKAEEGIKLPLTLPDGTETEEYLVIRGTDSRVFKQKQARLQKRKLDFLREKSNREDPDKLLDFETETERELIASLVAGWSFEKDCTESAVIEFLRKAPQIQESLDLTAADRSLFFAGTSAS